MLDKGIALYHSHIIDLVPTPISFATFILTTLHSSTANETQAWDSGILLRKAVQRRIAMLMTRRATAGLVLAPVATRVAQAKTANHNAIDLNLMPVQFHEHAMRAAIAVGRPALYPFGAVIVRPPSGDVIARGANNVRVNPCFHGEIVCMDNYVARHGNQEWQGCVLYTTGEPCPMCMSALVWAGIGGVVYGTSVEKLSRHFGIDQIAISATEVVAASSSFRHVALLGGILANETDALFNERLQRQH
jgi:tRNA(adenine34) deaminase